MAEEQNKGDKPDLQPAARPFPLISYLFSAAQMSQFKPAWIILNASLLGSRSCSLAPRTEVREVTMVREGGRKGEEKEKAGRGQREKRRKRERVRREQERD